VTRLNVGCGTHYAKGWTNLDVHRDPAAGINPDVVASITDLSAWGTHSVASVYAGHVAEHLSIHDNHCWGPGESGSTFDQAMAEVRRVLAPNGSVCFVCPDVKRALQWWKEGRADWALVDACLEGPDDGIDPASAWDGCFHAWNASEERLLGLVRRTFPNARAVPMDSPELAAWPVVSRAGWQCAVIASP
jgi:SAM-dependent methyltransferase